MINKTTHKIRPPRLQIYIAGSDPLKIRDLMEELSVRFRKRIYISVFETEAACLYSINKRTDIVFYVGVLPVENDYSGEISARRKIRIKNHLTDVFVLHNEAQKTEAIDFLYDILQLNSFFGICRLRWKDWIIAPLAYFLKTFQRYPRINRRLLVKSTVLNKLEVS